MSTVRQEEQYWEPPKEEALFNSTYLRLAFEKFINDPNKPSRPTASDLFKFLMKQNKKDYK